MACFLDFEELFKDSYQTIKFPQIPPHLGKATCEDVDAVDKSEGYTAHLLLSV